DAIAYDGIGRLEEEHRTTTRGTVRWRARTHFACMVGEVATDAVDAVYGKRAGTAHCNSCSRRRRDDIAHACGRTGLPRMRNSPSTTRVARAPRRPRTGLPRCFHSL